jgi:hypothetical protein
VYNKAEGKMNLLGVFIMKKFIISVLLAFVMIASAAFSVSAHPATLASGTEGTASSLITVKKPDSSSTTTMKTTYSVTGVGKEGVSVCFYVYDGTNYVAQKNSDSNPLSITIGASGVFYKQISLKEGLNRICVRAEASDGRVQLVYLSINVIKNEVMSNIGNISVDLQSKYNGWLN